MPKSTSISLGEHFDTFVAEQLNSGRYSSTSEVARAGPCISYAFCISA